MMRRLFCLIAVLFLAAGAVVRPTPAHADEGMWTFNNFPADKVGQLYGFKPDTAWLDHVRLASVRLALGCSGSIVSPLGLVQTNHHCAHQCIEQLSTARQDRVASGFYAKREEDEVKCPEMEIDQLVAITDVTDRINKAVAGKQDAYFAAAYKSESATIQKECAKGDDRFRCDIVNLYHGGEYNLYRYRRYQDVRLVFAPEFAIAFFGGDPDNFEFPRYDLDVSYVRIYEDGKPLNAKDYFPYSAADVHDGQLTFVSGNPGRTSRLDTVAELTAQRDYDLPHYLFYLAELRGVLTQFGTESPEHARIAGDDLFGIENSFKGLKGRFEALVDPTLLDAKRIAETRLQAKVAANPALQSKTAGAWDNIAKATQHRLLIADRFSMLETGRGLRSQLFAQARYLVRYAAESGKPDQERLKEYTVAAFPLIRQKILSKAPVYPDLEKVEFTFALTKLREVLGVDDPAVKEILGRYSPADLAALLIGGTGLKDPQYRQKLLDGGAAAINASTDPMIAFARRVDPYASAVRKDYEDNVEAPLDKNAGLIATAIFQVYGTSSYPDATFTARLSYGQAKGYVQDGKSVPPWTVMSGLFDRATGSVPFQLPASWLAAKSSLDMAQPMNFVSTNDIIGGNSGSPVINQKAQVVGLIFDGDIQSLGGEYGFDPKVNRAVAVSVGALREALAKVYHADRLVKELAPVS